MRYQDLGWDYYERERATARQVSHHVGKLASLDYEVALSKRPGSDEIPKPPDIAKPEADGTNRPSTAAARSTGAIFSLRVAASADSLVVLRK